MKQRCKMRNCLPTVAKSSTRYHNIDILTATPALNLVAAQFEQLPEDVQTTNVRKVLTFDRSYEYAVLDLPPALTKLTEKVITLSDSVFIPIELGTFCDSGHSRCNRSACKLQRQIRWLYREQIRQGKSRRYRAAGIPQMHPRKQGAEHYHSISAVLSKTLSATN